MTDKELIKQEIERRIDEICEDGFVLKENQQEYETLTDLEDFIDSLPEESVCEVNCTTKNEDLEEELYSWMRENCDDDGFFNQLELARHFAEWQKQQMMKDVVELHIIESFNPIGTEDKKPHGFTALCDNAEYPDFYPVMGQTIKVIPIKNDFKNYGK